MITFTNHTNLFRKENQLLKMKNRKKFRKEMKDHYLKLTVISHQKNCGLKLSNQL